MKKKVYSKIQFAIDKGVLCKDLCNIVVPPSELDIENYLSFHSISLSSPHCDLLLEWGGSNLDEIRILSLEYIEVRDSKVVFANNYNGFSFSYDSIGRVYSEDHDGGESEFLSSSVDEFINEFVFGEKGKDFYGEDWIQELKNNGIA